MSPYVEFRESGRVAVRDDGRWPLVFASIDEADRWLHAALDALHERTEGPEATVSAYQQPIEPQRPSEVVWPFLPPTNKGPRY